MMTVLSSAKGRVMRIVMDLTEFPAQLKLLKLKTQKLLTTKKKCQ